MRVAIVFFPGKNRDKLLAISKALAEGIEANGHQVDLVDASRDADKKLSIYEYLAIGTESISIIGGKIPEQVVSFLSMSGMVAGKRSFAFVVKRPFGNEKALGRLMKSMEAEGMFLKFSEILTSSEEAVAIGKRLKVRND